MSRKKTNIKVKPDLPSLKRGGADYIASAIKATGGAIPADVSLCCGPLFAELICNIIPNQRIDRVVKYMEALQERLGEFEEEFVKAQLTNENFTDVVDESIRQAARSLSDERRQYLASVVANGIKSEDIEFFETKHLLRILGEIIDVEVIILEILSSAMIGRFEEKHKEIFRPRDTSLPDQAVSKRELYSRATSGTWSHWGCWKSPTFWKMNWTCRTKCLPRTQIRPKHRPTGVR